MCLQVGRVQTLVGEPVPDQIFIRYAAGKNDKVDAKRIAIYASRFGDKVKYYDRPTEEIERLKQLERERALYVTDLAKYKGQMYDQKDFMPAALYRKKKQSG